MCCVFVHTIKLSVSKQHKFNCSPYFSSTSSYQNPCITILTISNVDRPTQTGLFISICVLLISIVVNNVVLILKNYLMLHVLQNCFLYFLPHFRIGFPDFWFCLKSNILMYSEGPTALQKSLFLHTFLYESSLFFSKRMKTIQAIKITVMRLFLLILQVIFKIIIQTLSFFSRFKLCCEIFLPNYIF